MMEGGGSWDTIVGTARAGVGMGSDGCVGAEGAGAWKSANAGAAMATSEGAGERGLRGSGALGG